MEENTKKTGLNLGLKISIFIGAVLAVSFLVIGYYVYNTQKKQVINDLDIQMKEQVKDITAMLDIQIKERQKQVDIALQSAHYLFYHYGELREDTSEIVEMQAVNQITKNAFTVSLPKWRLGNTPIHNNFVVVDKIKGMGVETATIFQKIDQGYLRISTNVMKLDNTRAVGTFIPNDSPVIRTIESGGTFRGRAYVVNAWYLTAYEPIRIDGEIKGILYVGVKEKDKERLREIFYDKNLMKNTTPFMVNAEGEYIIHPEREGESIANEEFFTQMKNHTGESISSSKYTSEIDGDVNSFRQYFTYYQPLDAYVGITTNETKTVAKLAEIRNALIISGLIVFIITNILIYFFVQLLVRNIHKVRKAIGDLSNGKIIKSLSIKARDEIGKISLAVNKLIGGLAKTAEFADEIGKGKLDAEYTPLSEDDVLGNSLLKMRDSLKQAKEEEAKRKIEDEQRNWATEGLARFGDILRQRSNNLQDFAYEIISNLVKYVKANQGGLFMVDEKAENLELLANYAYERRKFADLKIEIGDGLIGSCAYEKETIYMTDIPDDYVNIRSGLGGSNPRSIIMVPLKLEEEIYGVVEIASFKAFEQFEIDFLEKIAESIASTIAGVKVNMRTEQLLKQAQDQGEQLKQQEEEMRQNMEEMQTTQEEAAKREVEMKGLLNAIGNSMGTIEMDLNGLIQEVNENYLSLIDKKRNEIIGKRHDGIFVSDSVDADIYAMMWENLQGGLSFELDVKYMKGQKEVWLHESYTPVRNNEESIFKILALVNDITESKKMENDLKVQAENLRAQEEEMRQNLEEMKTMHEEREKREVLINGTLNAINNTVPIFEYDSSGVITDINQLGIELLGYDKAELTGKHHSIFFDNKDITKSDNYKKFWEDMKAGKHFEGVMKRICKDGSSRIVQATISPFIDNEGNLIKVVELMVDITAIKEKEEKMRQQTEEMQAQEEELRQNMEELEATQEQMKKLSEEQKQKDQKIKDEYEQQIMDIQTMMMEENEKLEKQLEQAKKEIAQLKNKK